MQERRERASNPVFRFVNQLPVKVTNRAGAECTLEARDNSGGHEHSIVLVEPNGREWVVRFARYHEIRDWNLLLYSDGLVFFEAWQTRLMAQLVGEGKAAYVTQHGKV